LGLKKRYTFDCFAAGQFFVMTPDFWMNLQMRWDLYFVQKEESKIVNMPTAT
jgi:plasmid maintenance system antidote protein VapI